MGKKIGLALLVIGGIVLFILGLPVTFYILFRSSPQYDTPSVVIAALISVLFFVLIPSWVMKKGYTNYTTATRMEKEKQEYQSQLKKEHIAQQEKEQMAIELEKIKHRRREMEEAGSKTPSVIREREIIKEIIKIKCRYCGKLHDERRDKCPHCGA